MDARTVQVHGSARLKCHETEKQTLPSSVGRRGAPDGLAELSVTDSQGTGSAAVTAATRCENK